MNLDDLANIVANWFGVFGGTVLLVTAGLLVTRVLWPSWDLLARSLYPRTLAGYGQAFAALVTLLGIGVQRGSLYRAARLRIEAELLDPETAEPLRIDFANDTDHSQALTEWRNNRAESRRQLRVRLRSLAHSDHHNGQLDIGTPSPLITNDDDIRRYFNALKRHRATQPEQFLSPVSVRSGFLAPLHLLTGVLERYGEEWRPVIEAYSSSIAEVDDKLRHTVARRIQSFAFDCWLLWGPSVPLCHCSRWYGQLALQYGYGDEDNSLAVLCGSDIVLQAVRGPSSALAVRAGVTGILRWGPSLGEYTVPPAQQAIWRDNRLVLDAREMEKPIQRAGGLEQEIVAGYYSAYLWVVFVMCDENEEPVDPARRWRNVVPFFEHGNVADEKTYQFYVRTLARKAVTGALSLLRGDESGRLRLRLTAAVDGSGCGHELVCPPGERLSVWRAMDAVLEGLDREKVPELGRLVLEDLGSHGSPWQNGDYSACALPRIVQDYYESTQAVTIRELRHGVERDVVSLGRLYDEQYVKGFPDPDERETLKAIRRALADKDYGRLRGRNNYHVLVAENDDGAPVGGLIADYLHDANSGVIEYVFVDARFRGSRVASRLLTEAMDLIEKDARRAAGRPLSWMFAEVDDPVAPTALTEKGFDPRTRALVWHHWGYRRVDFSYRQPPLSRKQEAVTRLMLTARPGERGEHVAGADSIPADDLLGFLEAYIRDAMRIKHPTSDKRYRDMEDELRGRTAVALCDLEGHVGRPAEGASDAQCGGSCPTTASPVGTISPVQPQAAHQQ